jgi:hypothetical protein
MTMAGGLTQRRLPFLPEQADFPVIHSSVSQIGAAHSLAKLCYTAC